MEGTSDTRKVPQIHGRYLRYMECTSNIYIDFVRTVLKPQTRTREVTKTPVGEVLE